jgi:hypothetical protein
MTLRLVVHLVVCGAIAGLASFGPASTVAGPPEIAPSPRPAGPRAAIVATKNGYQVILNRTTTEALQQILDKTDEKQVANSIREKAKEARTGPAADESQAATLELVAFLVSTQVPGFRKALHESAGPGGVIITLTGLQAPKVMFRKPRPLLEKAAELVRGAMPLVPDEAREVLEALRAVARTTPLLWKVEPRP